MHHGMQICDPSHPRHRVDLGCPQNCHCRTVTVNDFKNVINDETLYNLRSNFPRNTFCNWAKIIAATGMLVGAGLFWASTDMSVVFSTLVSPVLAFFLAKLPMCLLENTDDKLTAREHAQIFRQRLNQNQNGINR